MDKTSQGKVSKQKEVLSFCIFCIFCLSILKVKIQEWPWATLAGDVLSKTDQSTRGVLPLALVCKNMTPMGAHWHGGEGLGSLVFSPPPFLPSGHGCRTLLPFPPRGHIISGSQSWISTGWNEEVLASNEGHWTTSRAYGRKRPHFLEIWASLRSYSRIGRSGCTTSLLFRSNCVCWKQFVLTHRHIMW